jgi:methyl-accepting chemotaxis protein
MDAGVDPGTSAGRLARWRAGMAGWLVRLSCSVAPRVAPQPECSAVAGMRELDTQVLTQLDRAVGLSEHSALRFIERLSGLRALSAKLISYLSQAQTQSQAMQAGIELNSKIIRELATFVQTLPAQIAQERNLLRQLLADVKGLSEMTETIRGIARQTEILAINAAIEAARAGEAGKGFAVLAGEVRRLATQSSATATKATQDIASLVRTVEVGYSGEFEVRTRHNEAEAARLGGLTRQLDDSYIDLRQFYDLLMTAVTQHNTELDTGIGSLLDTAQYQDVFKQIVDRVQPALDMRNSVLGALIARLRAGQPDTTEIEARAQALASDYLAGEAAHRDPDAAADEAPGDPGKRIELF